MTDQFLHCPGCGSTHEFVQVHPRLEPCPDSAGGGCPEWFCTGCGAALLLGLPPARRRPAAVGARTTAGRLDRVA